MRADFAAPSATHGSSAGNHNATSFGESAFGNTGTSHGNVTTASTPATAAERPLATAQQVIDQIKVNITRAAKAGLDKVTIQLKPIELGRIDVQLEMSEDHKVRVTVTADNKDTLALLQNDARTLERTLNDAGLRTDANNLHFSLRSDSDAQNAGDGKNGGTNSKADAAGATTEDDDIAMTYDYAAAARVRGGIDTFA
jgi:flagellar hook-length control protein FliK